MKYSLRLISAGVLFYFFGCQTTGLKQERIEHPWDKALSAESNIAMNAIALENDGDFSFLKEISQTEYEQTPGWYNQFRLLGENLDHIFGDEVYSLAFTSLTPNFPGEECGELESAIAESADCPFAFIDFNALRFREGYRDVSFDCSILGKKKGRWLNIYDGLFYMKDQQRM